MYNCIESEFTETRCCYIRQNGGGENQKQGDTSVMHHVYMQL